MRAMHWMWTVAGLCLWAAPAPGVVILDSTWAEEGGDDTTPELGFDAAKALAQQPQFRATIAFGEVDEEAEEDAEPGWGGCSGTWVGNVEGQAYVLTAAHCYTAEADPAQYVYRDESGAVYAGVALQVHPDYVDTATTTGYDLAVVVLDAPIEQVGPPPVLYAGDDEAGRLLTFMGYGSRGIGSVGEADVYYDGAGDKAAAQGVVDVVHGGLTDDDEDDYLGTFLPREDGGVANPYGGSAVPVNRLAGLLGSGDSGGAAFIQVDGRWRLAGVNSNGSGKAQYGDSSWFVRLSARRAWIEAQVPGVRFAR